MEDDKSPADGHLDLPPPERDTLARELVRVVRDLLSPPLATNRAEDARMHRLVALAEAHQADRRLDELVGAVLNGDTAELGGFVEVPFVLDDEHVHLILSEWVSLNSNCIANLIEVGDVIKHAPETVSTDALDTFALMVADSRASIERSLRNA